MRSKGFFALMALNAFLVLSGVLAAWGEESVAANAQSNAQNNGAAVVVGHPFSAIKYARQIKVLRDGRQQFIRNERYPIQIARDTDGRVMMYMISTEDLLPECDHLDLPVPPICPAWGVFIIDPVAHTIAHWPEGERANHGAVDFPLSEPRMEQSAHATADLPELPPDFTDKDGEVATVDLGHMTIEGIQAQGVRSTLRYTKTESGRTMHLTRIHEVWSASEMRLIIRVIDGNPNGVETVWGLEKISTAPDPALFQPPTDYEWEHRSSDKFAVEDYEYLNLWFSM